MFQMFRQLFATISSFLSAAEKLGTATNHLSTWAEESAGAFADEARITRAQKKIQLDAHTNAIQTRIAATPKARGK